MIYSINAQSISTNYIGHTVHSGSWLLKERTISEYELIFQIEGSCDFYINSIRYPLQKGDLLIIPNDTLHSAYSKTSGRFYFAHISPEGIENTLKNHMIQSLNQHKSAQIDHLNKNAFYILPPSLNKLFIPTHLPLIQSLNTIKQLFDQCLVQRDHFTLYSSNIINSLMTQILSIASANYIETVGFTDVFADYGQVHPLLNDAHQYIQQNIPNGLTVAEISDYLDITPQYLNKLFRKHKGCTTIEFINHQRIKLAKKLIENTSLSLIEITYKIGLDNPYYFSRLYKKTEGIAPSVHRKLHSNLSNG